MTEINEYALKGIRAEIERLQTLERELSKTRKAKVQLSGITLAGIPKERKRRRMSAAARKRISDAQKARWAKQKAGKKR